VQWEKGMDELILTGGWFERRQYEYEITGLRQNNTEGGFIHVEKSTKLESGISYGTSFPICQYRNRTAAECRTCFHQLRASGHASYAG
jgi:hypothetical protein